MHILLHSTCCQGAYCQQKRTGTLLFFPGLIEQVRESPPDVGIANSWHHRGRCLSVCVPGVFLIWYSLSRVLPTPSTPRLRLLSPAVTVPFQVSETSCYLLQVSLPGDLSWMIAFLIRWLVFLSTTSLHVFITLLVVLSILQLPLTFLPNGDTILICWYNTR